MTDLIAYALKSNLGLEFLHWATSQSDIWHAAHRVGELVHKINEPLEKSAYVLDNLLTMDEDDIDCIGIRDLRLQQMHFDDEDDYNVQFQSRSGQQQHDANGRRARTPNTNYHHSSEQQSGKKIRQQQKIQ